MATSRRRVAVLGSGLLAASVVAALVDTGGRVRVWGATASWYLAAFADRGVRTATSPRAAVGGAEVVVLAPSDHADRVAFEAQLSGHLSTTTVVTVREPGDAGAWSATWLSGADHLDCLVCGDPAGLGSESVVILVSGTPSLVERHRELLDGLGVAISLGGPPVRSPRSEIALVGLWYDVSIAVLRALANIDPSARPVVELELQAIVAQLPSVIRSVDTGDPVRDDAGMEVHARALATVIAGRRRGGCPSAELEHAARQIDSLMAREADPRSPLARIARSLRWPGEPERPDRPEPG